MGPGTSEAFEWVIRKMIPLLALAALWLVGRWTMRFGSIGWRWRLPIALRAESRNGGSTQRRPFGHNGFLEVPT